MEEEGEQKKVKPITLKGKTQLIARFHAYFDGTRVRAGAFLVWKTSAVQREDSC